MYLTPRLIFIVPPLMIFLHRAIYLDVKDVTHYLTFANLRKGKLVKCMYVFHYIFPLTTYSHVPTLKL